MVDGRENQRIRRLALKPHDLRCADRIRKRVVEKVASETDPVNLRDFATLAIRNNILPRKVSP